MFFTCKVTPVKYAINAIAVEVWSYDAQFIMRSFYQPQAMPIPIQDTLYGYQFAVQPPWSTSSEITISSPLAQNMLNLGNMLVFIFHIGVIDNEVLHEDSPYFIDQNTFLGSVMTVSSLSNTPVFPLGTITYTTHQSKPSSFSGGTFFDTATEVPTNSAYLACALPFMGPSSTGHVSLSLSIANMNLLA